MAKIVSVKPLDNYKIFVEFSDGLKGELNLKHLLKRKEYEKLNDLNVFNSVRIDAKTKDIIWDGGMNICKVAVYNMLELKNEMKKLKIDLNRL